MGITINMSFDQEENIFNYFKFKAEPSIYFIYDDVDNLLYIGRAKNTYDRIRDQINSYESLNFLKEYKPLFSKVKVIYDNYENVILYSPFLIKKYNPVLNTFYSKSFMDNEVVGTVNGKLKIKDRTYIEKLEKIKSEKFKFKCQNWIEPLLNNLKSNPNKEFTPAHAGGSKFKYWINDNWKDNEDVIRKIFKENGIDISIKGKADYKYLKYVGLE